MRVDRMDHLVLTVADVDQTIRFYVNAPGMKEVVFGQGRKTLAFGRQKINLHQKGAEIEPKAFSPAPGWPDLGVITTSPWRKVVQELQMKDASIECGPVIRSGAWGKIRSLYLRGSDQNLTEISRYDKSA